jgi:hypothetical protein
MQRQFDVEIKSLRGVFNQDQTLAPITERQLAGLNALLNSGLQDHEKRIPVVRLITGLDRLKSTKQLTLHTANVFITEMKDGETWTLNDYGRWLISEAEKRVEKLVTQPKKGMDTIRNAPNLSDLWTTNS